MREAFLRRRDLGIQLLKEIPNVQVNTPQGAFYLFPKVDTFFGKSWGNYTINNVTDVAMYLLEVGQVATVGGAAFGAPTCLRLSYATSDEKLTDAIGRISAALAKLA
jgi:aspartate aminotransferase